MTDLLVQQILSQTESTQKRTLFNHFFHIAKKLYKNPDQIHYENIEEISAFIKANIFDYINPKEDLEINTKIDFSNELTEYTN